MYQKEGGKIRFTHETVSLIIKIVKFAPSKYQEKKRFSAKDGTLIIRFND
jgi:hypothetical protein